MSELADSDSEINGADEEDNVTTDSDEGNDDIRNRSLSLTAGQQ